MLKNNENKENEDNIMKEITCKKGCCLFRTLKYDESLNIPYVISNETIKKAGCFIYDLLNKKILLVQSRGQLWGPPKGSIQENENPLECAIREVKEETGLNVVENDFVNSVIIQSKSLYYYIDIDSTCQDVNNIFPQTVKDNDANGIGWFTIDCLIEMIQEKQININKNCRLLIKRVFNINIPLNQSTNHSNVKKCLLHTLTQS